MGYTGCATIDEMRTQAAVRRDHHRRRARDRTCTTCRSPRKRRTTGSSDDVDADRPRRTSQPTSRDDPHPRLRRAVHAADRAPRARDRRLLRDPSRATSADEFVRAFGADAASSSPAARVGVRRSRPPRAPQAVFELGVPVLGICYGMQTMAQQLGGEVEAGQRARVRLRRGARARPHRAARRHRGLRDAPRATACSTSG